MRFSNNHVSNESDMHRNYFLLNRFYCVVVFIIILFSSCATVSKTSNPLQQKIAPEKLQQDFALLKKILDANHPGLYWYTPQDSINYYYNVVYSSLSDSLTEFQFRSKVAWFVSKIHCGHTSVRASDTYAKYVQQHKQPAFPLYLKVWNDSLIVIGNLNNRDSILKRGVAITAIEGMRNRLLLDSMFQFISTDGYGDNFKNQVCSFSFPLYYSLAFPLKDSFAITYIDSTGSQQQTYIKLYRTVKDTTKATGVKAVLPKPSRKETKDAKLQRQRSFTVDTESSLAYMRVATFTPAHLRSFFKESFKKLDENNIPNLVIDLRENSGGNIMSSITLARYLKTKSFHAADTVAAINRSFAYGRYIHPSFPFKLFMFFTTRKKSDGKFHFGYLERHEFTPYSNLHYNGNIYLLQGGFTFSAAAMFVEFIKDENNVTVVGEETGGGHYGTSAVHLPDIILPNSKLCVVLPVYRVVIGKNEPHDGRGIQPDVEVLPSSLFIKNGVDGKLQKVKEMIKEKKE